MIRALALAALLQAAPGKKPPDALNLMLKKGELLLEDSFTAESWGSKDWNKYKGKWEIVGDQLKVAEVASDAHHPAVSRKAELNCAVIQFKFKFDGAGWLGFSFDGKEHVARCMMRPDAFQVVRMSGIGGTTKGETIDEKKVKLADGAWHTIVIEIGGKEMLAQIDNTHFIFGEKAGVETDKTRFEFISGGQFAWFDDLKIWKAEPDPKWAQKKQLLIAQTKKRS
ncbi:MAG TPA: hypothetical protein VF950_03460 [Planctomycetota bacterium]